MWKLGATLIYPLTFIVLSGCSTDVPASGPPQQPSAVVEAPPLTGKAGRASKAAQKKLERKQALKLKTMVKRDPMVKPDGD